MKRLASFLALIVVWSMVALYGPRQLAAQPNEGPTAVILSPGNGQQLFGVENIRGSAAHPTNFDSYTLEYNDLANPNAQWLLVQPRVRQQVQDGVLGAWNTTVVPDGMYHLRLRVFTVEGQVTEFVVNNLRVANAEPTPVPTAAGSQGAAAPPAPTAGPSPTSPVQQPQSNNPAVGSVADDGAAEPAGGAPPSAPPVRAETRVDLGRIRGAFCTGAYLAGGAFGLMVMYVVLRRRPRGSAQPGWPPAEDEWQDIQ